MSRLAISYSISRLSFLSFFLSFFLILTSVNPLIVRVQGYYCAWSRSMTLAHIFRIASPGRVFGLWQRPLPENTQHSQETDDYVRSAIWNPSPSIRAANGIVRLSFTIINYNIFRMRLLDSDILISCAWTFLLVTSREGTAIWISLRTNDCHIINNINRCCLGEACYCKD